MYELMAEDGGDPDCPECEGDMLYFSQGEVTIFGDLPTCPTDDEATEYERKAKAKITNYVDNVANGDAITHDNTLVELFFGPEDLVLMGAMKVFAVVPFIVKTGKVATKIPFSSASLGKVAKSLEHGATSATVKSKSEAEELFLALYQADKRGYKNTTGFSTKEMKDLYLFPKGKQGTYHWDLNDTQHGGVPHLQIHDFDGRIIRIFFPE